MKIIVKYFAMIREFTQKKEETLDLIDGSSIKDLISTLSNFYGHTFKKNVVLDDGYLKEGLILLINGEFVNSKDFGDRILDDGDVAAIIPPVGGG
jgi:MoaD family protein